MHTNYAQRCGRWIEFGEERQSEVSMVKMISDRSTHHISYQLSKISNKGPGPNAFYSMVEI